MLGVTFLHFHVFQGLFGNTAATQSGGLFGAAQTSTATGFGTATGLFGQPNTGFGNLGTQVATWHATSRCVLQKLPCKGIKVLKVIILCICLFVTAKLVWQQDDRFWHHNHQCTILWHWHWVVWQQACTHSGNWNQHIILWYCPIFCFYSPKNNILTIVELFLNHKVPVKTLVPVLTVLTVVTEGFGTSTAGGSLFGTKPATGGLGTGLGTTFGTGTWGLLKIVCYLFVCLVDQKNMLIPKL